MYPRPEYFIIRPGARQGTIVPLVAADQLPDWLQLSGIPRELGGEQASGLVNLGVVDREDDSVYEVHLRTDMIRAILNGTSDVPETPGSSAGEKDMGEKRQAVGEEAGQQRLAAVSREGTAMTMAGAGLVARNNNLREKSMARTDEMRAAAAASTTVVQCDRSEVTVSASSRERSHHGKPDQRHQQHEDRQRALELPSSEPRLSSTSRHNDLTDNQRDKLRCIPATATQHRSNKDSNKAITSSLNTIYCRHWCHHGTCKWGRDCRYQHRMPTSWEGLREVGLRDFPTWYLLVMGAEGFPAGPRRGGGRRGEMDVDMLAVSTGADARLSTSLRHSSHPAEALLLSSSSSSSSSPPSPSSLSSSSSRHSHTYRPAHLSQQQQQQQQQQHSHHHPSPMDLRLIQGRMSALLSGSTAMSNRQKLRQIKEMRELFLRTSNAASSSLPEPATSLHLYATMLGGRGRGPHGGHLHRQGRTNLYTESNSRAALTANLSATGRRHGAGEEEDDEEGQGVRAAEENLIPADMMIQRARRKGRGRGGAVAETYGRDDEEQLDGRLSRASSDLVASEEDISVSRRGDEKLVDID